MSRSINEPQILHDLDGTIHMGPDGTWYEAERRAHEAAKAWFGDSPYDLRLNVKQQRTIGGDIFGYEVDFTAAPR